MATTYMRREVTLPTQVLPPFHFMRGGSMSAHVTPPLSSTRATMPQVKSDWDALSSRVGEVTDCAATSFASAWSQHPFLATAATNNSFVRRLVWNEAKDLFKSRRPVWNEAKDLCKSRRPVWNEATDVCKPPLLDVAETNAPSHNPSELRIDNNKAYAGRWVTNWSPSPGSPAGMNTSPISLPVGDLNTAPFTGTGRPCCSYVSPAASVGAGVAQQKMLDKRSCKPQI